MSFRTVFIGVFALLALPAIASHELKLDVKLGSVASTEDWYQMAVWLEQGQHNYLETLFVTKSVGKEGLGNNYQSMLGLTIREEPGSLPVWAHDRNISIDDSLYPSKDEPLPDGMTGATLKQPAYSQVFSLSPALAARLNDQPWRCLLEINVSRDGVPSLIYAADVSPGDSGPFNFRFLGFGEENGNDGAIHKHSDEVDPAAFITSARMQLKP